jgi:hypothetical protein
MRARTLTWSALLVSLFVDAGCLTHLPPSGHLHMAIPWRATYAEARDEAARTQRPLLVLLVAGEIDGLC